MRIYKFPLILKAEPQEIFLPEESRPLCVQMQRDTPTAWVLLDPFKTGMTAYWFQMFGTGAELPANIDSRIYLGTVQVSGYVRHWFWNKNGQTLTEVIRGH